MDSLHLLPFYPITDAEFLFLNKINIEQIIHLNLNVSLELDANLCDLIDTSNDMPTSLNPIANNIDCRYSDLDDVDEWPNAVSQFSIIHINCRSLPKNFKATFH